MRLNSFNATPATQRKSVPLCAPARPVIAYIVASHSAFSPLSHKREAQLMPGPSDRQESGGDGFASLLKTARPRMFLVALAIVADRTEAEDVLQDATITGLSKYRAGEFTRGTNFDAWMGQITRYTALNARRARQGSATPLGDSAQRQVATPLDSLSRNGTIMDTIEDTDLRVAMEQLTETPRLCLVLRIVGGLPYSSIAQIAGVPEGTAMSHVHRAQRTLRQVLMSRVEHGARASSPAVNAPTQQPSKGGTR